MVYFEEKGKEFEESRMVVLSNTLARKYVNWGVHESKMFLMTLERIEQISSENEVQLSKKEIINYLKLGEHYSDLRKIAKRLRDNSEVCFGNDEEFCDGLLIYNFRTTKKDVFVSVNPLYLPLLKDLKSYYTYFFLEDVQHFKSKFALQLFQSLRSHWNKYYMYNLKRYYTKELFELFGLEMGKDYVNKSGAFDRYNFEKYTLDRAIEEINQLDEQGIIQSKIFIVRPEGEKKFYKKGKDKRGNVYYDIQFAKLKGHNEISWDDSKQREFESAEIPATKRRTEQKVVGTAKGCEDDEIADGQTTIYDYV